VLGPAGTNFNDYVGTVAADDADAVMERPSLYELAQIDRDRYTIVAVDLTVDGPTTATIYESSMESRYRLRLLSWAEAVSRFRLCRSISPHRALKSSSGKRSEGSRCGW
jgi:hypothetical protein